MRKQGMADLFVYIIRSQSKDWNYVGFTKSLELRLKEHNSGQVSSTKAYRPYTLIFAQLVFDTKQARQLEKFLKVRFNKEALLNLID